MPALPPFQVLLDEHAPAVLRFLCGRLRHADAEDCFQETFLAALSAYPSLRDARNLRAWLLTIARNKAADVHRRDSRVALSGDTVEDVIDPGSVAEPGADRDLWTEVDGLPPKQRDAVTLRFRADSSYTDIAAVMATSEEAARRNVHEGIKKLRRGST